MPTMTMASSSYNGDEEWSTVNIGSSYVSRSSAQEEALRGKWAHWYVRKRVYLLPGAIEFEYAADDYAVWTLVRDGGAGDGGSYGDATIIGGSTALDGIACCQNHRFAFHVESSGWYTWAGRGASSGGDAYLRVVDIHQRSRFSGPILTGAMLRSSTQTITLSEGFSGIPKEAWAGGRLRAQATLRITANADAAAAARIKTAKAVKVFDESGYLEPAVPVDDGTTLNTIGAIALSTVLLFGSMYVFRSRRS